ncbi:substrate-binding domain-containing protein [Adlercreutzia agrestimuris]|uniref:substrate-binding domain-containing protein n=1 Tax=Adlercreutzia agrestimuris TaxID=2941324 RepID=UPI00203B9E92|nr:substrate-binding domain-containing protein [Adlercreutzia agrestimuris]
MNYQLLCSFARKALTLLFALCATGAALVSLGCAQTNLDTEPISVYSREDGSGTRSAFASLFGLETTINDKTVDTITPTAVVTNSTAVMMTSVASDPAAIGYISYGSLNDSVKALAIDGVVPSIETIKDRSYKVYRTFALVTDAPFEETSSTHNQETSILKNDFLRFVSSEQGQAIIESEGFVSALSDPALYERAAASQRPHGKLVIAGSSSVTGIMEKLSEAYEELNPDASIEVQQSDSTTGISMVQSGTCDIGMTSRDLTSSEEASGMVATPLAYDGIAVIVNPDFPLDDLSSTEVARIFSGEIKTFGELPSWQQTSKQNDTTGA